MKKIYFLFLIFPLFSQAQNIKGSVLSQKNNNPIENVNIESMISNNKTSTNHTGSFSINLSSNFKDTDTLQFSHISYATLKISLADLKHQNFIVLLSEKTETLKELTIEKNQKSKLKAKLAFNKLAPFKNAISSFGSFLKDEKIYITGGNTYYESDALERLKSKNVNSDEPRFLEKYLQELRLQSTSNLYKGDLLIYDIKKDSWHTSELKFKKRAFHNINYYNNNIYVLGGKRISPNGKFEYLQDQIEVFDLEKQSITIDKTNPHQASNAISFTYKDNIIVMGGSIRATEKGKKDFTNKVHLYNIPSGYWYELANMPIAKESSGGLIDNKIYLIGGNNGNLLSGIESFDLTTEKWETEGGLFSEIERPAVACHENIIYFFEDRKMCLYDTKSKQLKEYLVELNITSASMYFFDDKLYILGGNTFVDYVKISSGNVYSIALDEFETTKPNRIKTLQATIATTEIPKP